jgi:hypothetical protein
MELKLSCIIWELGLYKIKPAKHLSATSDKSVSIPGISHKKMTDSFTIVT